MKLVEFFLSIANFFGNLIFYIILFISVVIPIALFGWQNVLIFIFWWYVILLPPYWLWCWLFYKPEDDK